MKERITVYIEGELINDCRNASFWTRITLSEFVQEALKKHINSLQESDADLLLERKREIKKGRPSVL